jgi:hypothetical protein
MVKLNPILIKQHALNTYGGVEVQRLAVLICGIDIGDLSVLKLERFNRLVKERLAFIE